MEYAQNNKIKKVLECGSGKILSGFLRDFLRIQCLQLRNY